MDADEALKLLLAGEITPEEFSEEFSIKSKRRGRPVNEEKIIEIIKIWVSVNSIVDMSKARKHLGIKRKGGIGFKSHIREKVLPSKFNLSSSTIDTHLSIWGRFAKRDWPILVELIFLGARRSDKGFIRKVASDPCYFIYCLRGKKDTWAELVDQLASQAYYFDQFRDLMIDGNDEARREVQLSYMSVAKKVKLIIKNQ